MGRHTITFHCGHEESRIIGGKLREQESKVAWLGTQDCWQCQRAAENAAAVETSAARGWPALTGSEKQVSWATSIRAEKLAALLLPVLAGALLEQAEARWWIDHRAESPEILAWRAVGEPTTPTRASFVATMLEGLGLRYDGGNKALAIVHRFGGVRGLSLRIDAPRPLEGLVRHVLVDRSQLAFIDRYEAVDGAWGWMPVEGAPGDLTIPALPG